MKRGYVGIGVIEDSREKGSRELIWREKGKRTNTHLLNWKHQKGFQQRSSSYMEWDHLGRRYDPTTLEREAWKRVAGTGCYDDIGIYRRQIGLNI